MSIDELMKPLRIDYIASFPSKIQNLESALKSQNSQLLITLFHQLLGSGTTFGFPEVSDIARIAEEALLNNPKDLPSAEQAVKKLQGLQLKA
jgi:HPt (histidine-containing phosphotransfer) domain-containing protein